MKLVLRVLETVLRNQKNLICKNRHKHLKRKCFSVLRQKQSCSHGVKDGCKNLQRFCFKLFKPFCLSSEQGLNGNYIEYESKGDKDKNITWKISWYDQIIFTLDMINDHKAPMNLRVNLPKNIIELSWMSHNASFCSFL